MTWLALLLASAAAAADPPPPAAAPVSRWVQQGSSLVLYDSSGTIAQEIPLGLWEESSGAQLHSVQTLGGTSASGRFAWKLNTTTVWNSSKTRTIRAGRLLSFFGAAPRELWSDRDADAPGGGSADPVAMSASGEVVAVAVRRDKEWGVRFKTYLGNNLLEERGFKSLSSIAVTPAGTCALVRWADPDRSATHTFIELSSKTRKDIPSEEFVLGPARMADDGKVYSGDRLVHDFSRPAAAKPDEP